MDNIKIREENFKKLGEMIEERNYIICHKVLYMIDTCPIIEEDSTGITVKIDLLEHRKLLEDLTNSYFTKKISTGKVERKIRHAYFMGNPFSTIKIYIGFR